MTIIFLSGCHGVGKTTLVNEVKIDRPLVKYTDVDMIDIKGRGFKQQMRRYTTMFEVIKSIPKNMNVIVDRSPWDFLIYCNVIDGLSKGQEETLNDLYMRLVELSNSLGPVINLLITDDIDVIEENIGFRGREGLSEEDTNWTRTVYRLFSELPKLHPSIIKLNYDDAQAYIEDLLK